MAQENISAMITNTVNILRDNLHDRYDSGFPVLKELIQNANDAKASELIISKQEGLKNAQHPLLKKQSLLVFNDGIVTDKDLLGIVSVAQGGKTGKEGVIGKFGLGMKSIFHFCDMFFYIAIIDNKLKTKLVNPFIDLRTNTDPFHKDWNILEENDVQKIEAITKQKIGKCSNGLMLWIPLRDNSYTHKVLSDIYDIEDIWKQPSEILRKNIALSLASLEVSTPCNNSERKLEKIIIETQEPKIEIEYKKNKNSIFSSGEEFCIVKNSSPIKSKEGEKKLIEIIKKDKFSKIFEHNENGEVKEISAYNANQAIAFSYVEFLKDTEKSLNIHWCSYLPLNSSADVKEFFEEINNEIHILVHANFAIDSGRRGIVDFNKCVDRCEEINIEFINDDKESQLAWNKVLIRDYILGNLLNFICEIQVSDNVMSSLNSIVCSPNYNYGYFCFSKGFAFKEEIKGFLKRTVKWSFINTKGIEETANQIIKKGNEYTINQESIKDSNFYENIIKISTYIQRSVENINWAIVNGKKELTDEDISTISEINAINNFPFLILPNNKVIKEKGLFKITDKNSIIKLLLSFEEKLTDKVGYVFECFCEDGCLDKDICKYIYTNSDVKQWVPLFKLSKVTSEQKFYVDEYKTFDEVVKINSNNCLFFHYGNNGKNTLLQKYKFLFPTLDLYMMSRPVAIQQFFLTEKDDQEIYRFSDDDTGSELKIFNYTNIESILISMENHIEKYTITSDKIVTDIIHEISNLSDERISKYCKLIRFLLVQREFKNDITLYRIIDRGETLNKTIFYKNLYENYLGENNFRGTIFNSSIEVSPTLNEILGIQDISYKDLEKRLEQYHFKIKELPNEQKDLLVNHLEDENLFLELPIHKTIQGDYVKGEGENIFLENLEWNFPNGTIPKEVKIIKKNPEIILQKYIKVLKAKNIVDLLLLDHSNKLGTYEGLILANEIKRIILDGKIEKDDISPKSKERKWIPNGHHEYFSFMEIISNKKITKNDIDYCYNLCLESDIQSEYRELKKHFLSDNEEVLKKMIYNHKNTTDKQWFWFNINDYKSLEEFEERERQKIVENVDDYYFELIKKLQLEEKKFSFIKQDFEQYFTCEENFVNQKRLKFLIAMCNKSIEGTEVNDAYLDLLVELFSLITKDDSISSFLNMGSNLRLPSAEKKWRPVNSLVNFSRELPDLDEKNTLNNRLFKFFEKEDERAGDSNDSEIIPHKKIIEQVLKCKNKKLWGLFAYLVGNTDERIVLCEYPELLEKDTNDVLRKLNIPKKLSITIYLHTTRNNYCKSLTGERVELKDAKEIDTIFFNKPCLENEQLDIHLFDNFVKFSSNSIKKAINELFVIYGITDIPNNFYDNLANPEQADINLAINMIFNSIIDTLKSLKLQLKAGKYNLIAEKEKKYREASGENDIQLMHECIQDIKRYIIADSGNIQSEIREKVIKFINDAEYNENCVLFELFQNADDAYCQLMKETSKIPYFSIDNDEKNLIIKHAGRPINQVRVGSPTEYKEDLINMLKIGWSDKSSMSKQTGKFGYGFKTVYLLAEEPHIISGDYNFIIKGALYPEQVSGDNDYSDETIINLKLNEKGNRKISEIIESFSTIAKYQILFSQKIRKIEINKKIYSWEPKITEKEHFIIEETEDYLVFKNRPSKENPHLERGILAFRKKGNKIIEFDKEAPKLWCMAPLIDLPNIGFALSANFKTNTGRQTLAWNDDKNNEILELISAQFSDLILELWQNNEFKQYIPSLINILLVGTTKERLLCFPRKVIEKFFKIGLVPDGVELLHEYKMQKIYSLSATYFDDKSDKQFEIINEFNQIIHEHVSDKILVVTQIALNVLKEFSNKCEEKRNVISIFDEILNVQDIAYQNKLLEALSNSDMYTHIKKQNEKLWICYLLDDKNQWKKVTDIFEVSTKYDSQILCDLINPTKEAANKYFKGSNFLGNTSNVPESHPEYEEPTVEEVYEWWLKERKSGKWQEDVLVYFEKKGLPSVQQFNFTPEELFERKSNTIPDVWCKLLWLAAAQSMPYNWGNKDTSNKNGMDVIESWGLFREFCEGENLEKVYNHYLDKTRTDETRIRLFEMLLRVHKYRRNESFADFHDLMKNLPSRKKETLTDLFVSSEDSELSGLGIKLVPGNRTFAVGYRLIIQNLSLCGFWKDSSLEDIKNLFKIFRGIKNDINLIGEEDILKEFYSCLDLPFLIYPGRNA